MKYLFAILILISLVMYLPGINAQDCEGITCEDSSTTCPDGTTVSCSNSCSAGVCSSCSPDCSNN